MNCKLCNVITVTYSKEGHVNTNFCGICGFPLFLESTYATMDDTVKSKIDVNKYCVIVNQDWMQEDTVNNFVVEKHFINPSFVIATFRDVFNIDFREKVLNFLDKNIHVSKINFIVLAPTICANIIFAKNIVKKFINFFSLLEKNGFLPDITILVYAYDINNHIIVNTK